MSSLEKDGLTEALQGNTIQPIASKLWPTNNQIEESLTDYFDYLLNLEISSLKILRAIAPCYKSTSKMRDTLKIVSPDGIVTQLQKL